MYPQDRGFVIGFPWNGEPNQIWIDLMTLTLADANRVIAGQEGEDCARAGVEKL